MCFILLAQALVQFGNAISGEETGTPDDPLNSGFEAWESLSSAPTGWILCEGLFPRKWRVEG